MPESCTLDPEPPPVPLLDQAFREGQAEAETDLVVLDIADLAELPEHLVDILR